MEINEKKYEQEWANWETLMENAKIYLEAANDLGSCIKDNEKTMYLSSKKIQIVVNELLEAKSLAEKLEFVEGLEG